jgi:hypothetical protein
VIRVIRALIFPIRAIRRDPRDPRLDLSDPRNPP